MSLSPAFRATLLAALCGAASVLAFAPFRLFPLAWLTLAALFALLDAAGGRRRAAGLGFAFGLGWFGLGTSWVYVSINTYGGLPAPLAALATLLFCLVLALFPALAALLFATLRRAPQLARAAAFAALWTLAEWARSWAFTGFPWLSLGYSQAPPSPLAGYAPVLGVYGVTLATAAAAALLVVSLRRGGAGPRRLAAVLALAVLALGAALRPVAWTAPQGEPLRVALLQGNVAQDLKWRPEQLDDSLRIYLELLRTHPAQLTLLPETAIPAFLDQVPDEYLRTLRGHARAQGGDVVFGVVTGEGDRYANAAVSLGMAPMQVYAKSHLVPFGEFVPPGFQWFLDLMQIPLSGFTPGPDRQAPLRLDGQEVAVDICYEDAFGTEIARALPQATLLVNLSNTAWFGDSLAAPQHLQIAQLRALETGRPMLRATNTGMTAVVAPDGTVQAVLPPFVRDALVAEVRGYAGVTPFARWGNLAALALAALLLAAAALAAKSQ